MATFHTAANACYWSWSKHFQQKLREWSGFSLGCFCFILFCFSIKRWILLFLKKFRLLEKRENKALGFWKVLRFQPKKKWHDWYDAEMPHALSISLGCVSWEMQGDRTQEAQQGPSGGRWVSGSLGGEWMYRALNQSISNQTRKKNWGCAFFFFLTRRRKK